MRARAPLFYVAILLCAACAAPAPRLFGGAPAPAPSFSAVASITFVTADGTSSSCSGILVAPSFVLTAGHCSFNVSLPSLSVAFPNNASQPAFSVLSAFTHPAFVASRVTNDVGLLRLAGHYDAAPFALVRNASLLASLPPCASVQLVGGSGSSVSNASLALVPHTYPALAGCVQQSGGSAASFAAQWNASYVGDDICLGFAPPCSAPAGSSGGARACGGDAGSPALYNGVVFAIASRADGGAACAPSPRPAVFTNIGAPENAAWIAAVLGGASLSAAATLSPAFAAPPAPPDAPPQPKVAPPSAPAVAWIATPAHVIGVTAGAIAAFLVCSGCALQYVVVVRPRRRAAASKRAGAAAAAASASASASAAASAGARGSSRGQALALAAAPRGFGLLAFARRGGGAPPAAAERMSTTGLDGDGGAAPGLPVESGTDLSGDVWLIRGTAPAAAAPEEAAPGDVYVPRPLRAPEKEEEV